VVESVTAFYQFREEFPTLSCECGHPLSLHSLNIEFHICLANQCYCHGFSVPLPTSLRPPPRLLHGPPDVGTSL
jgi:hypothetical protein